MCWPDYSVRNKTCYNNYLEDIVNNINYILIRWEQN
jgi:hypothetical protein